MHHWGRMQHHHHGSYDASMQAHLPLTGGKATPSAVVELIEVNGWGNAQVERLRDVEWARLLARPRAERLLGVTPEFVIAAG
jgi:hypothetical protein